MCWSRCWRACRQRRPSGCESSSRKERSSRQRSAWVSVLRRSTRRCRARSSRCAGRGARLASATRIELYGGDVLLELDAKHRYSADVKGAGLRAIPGTTGITGILDKSGPLVGWAKNVMLDYIRSRVVFDATGAFVLDQTGARLPLDEVHLATLLQDAKFADKRKTEKAATIGTTVHEWVESHITAILNEALRPRQPRNATVRNGVNAFLQWEAAHRVEYIF